MIVSIFICLYFFKMFSSEFLQKILHLKKKKQTEWKDVIELIKCCNENDINKTI